MEKYNQAAQEELEDFDLDPIMGTRERVTRTGGLIQLSTDEENASTWTTPITFPHSHLVLALSVGLWILCICAMIFGDFPGVLMYSESTTHYVLWIIRACIALPVIPLLPTAYFRLPMRTDFLNALPALILWMPIVQGIHTTAMIMKLDPWETERPIGCEERTSIFVNCALIISFTIVITYWTLYRHFAAFNALQSSKHNSAPVSWADVWAVKFGARKPGFVWEKKEIRVFGCTILRRWSVTKELSAQEAFISEKEKDLIEV